jgi:hypothetical protein
MFAKHVGSACPANQPTNLFTRDHNQFSRKNKAKPLTLASAFLDPEKSGQELTRQRHSLVV